ncbi:MAG: HD domain-containing phosphohydrolase [Sideroxyarcus sp.]
MNRKRTAKDILRTEAEAQLARMHPAETPAKSAAEILHELQVHQIELEMQNEELRGAQAALEESRDRYAALYEFAPVGYLTLTRSGQISEINLTGATLLGLERKKLLQDRFDHFVAPEDCDRWYIFSASLMGHTGKNGIELALKRGDGTVFYAHLDCIRLEAAGAEPELRMTLTDINAMHLNQQLLKAQDDLKEQLAFQTSLLESVPVPIFFKDCQGVYRGCNRAYEEALGKSRAQIIGKSVFDMASAEIAKKYHAMDAELFDHPGKQVYDWVILRPSGETRDVVFHKASFQRTDGSVGGLIGAVVDITERKQAVIALNHANRALAALGEVNRQLVYAANEAELLQAICEAIVKHSGYRMATVGYVQQDAEKTIQIKAFAGDNGGGSPDTNPFIRTDSGNSIEPRARAILSGATQVCQDISKDPQYLPLRKAALQHGYASSIAMPLSDADNSVFGVLSVYSNEANTFIPAEIALLEEMAGDLAFGVRTLRMRQEHDRSLEQNQKHLVQIRDNLDDTVRAIACIVEMRDPYTAGHQLRVAALASAIAGKMGLSDEQVYAVHLAGVLHDLGKIQIPAEILSKPTKLNSIEYSLIKTHSQAGYDILQGIKFPWPIAQMVLQHHERIDGSGYPQGLKNDAILPEARILAVSDVVEAISSHRPYRPALGIEAALAVIEQGSGQQFDPAVVAACIKVVRDHDMKLP